MTETDYWIKRGDWILFNLKLGTAAFYDNCSYLNFIGNWLNIIHEEANFLKKFIRGKIISKLLLKPIIKLDLWIRKYFVTGLQDLIPQIWIIKGVSIWKFNR